MPNQCCCDGEVNTGCACTGSFGGIQLAFTGWVDTFVPGLAAELNATFPIGTAYSGTTIIDTGTFIKSCSAFDIWFTTTGRVQYLVSYPTPDYVCYGFCDEYSNDGVHNKLRLSAELRGPIGGPIELFAQVQVIGRLEVCNVFQPSNPQSWDYTEAFNFYTTISDTPCSDILELVPFTTKSRSTTRPGGIPTPVCPDYQVDESGVSCYLSVLP